MKIVEEKQLWVDDCSYKEFDSRLFIKRNVNIGIALTFLKRKLIGKLFNICSIPLGK